MPCRRNGSTDYTLFELREYTNELEKRWMAMSQEVNNMTEHDLLTERAINALSMQQERMAEDIKEINVALKSVASSLSNLAVLEQKHVDSMDAIKRAHHRIDRMGEDFTKHRDKFDAKLNSLEVHQAKNVWVERFVAIIVTGVIALWIKGGL